jgi:hypothetical protein
VVVASPQATGLIGNGMECRMQTFGRLVLFGLLLFVVATFTGCGSSSPEQIAPPPPPPSKKIVPKFIYVANYGSASVSGFTISANQGSLASIPGSPFVTGSGPFSLVLDPSEKFLSVVNHSSFQISVFSIGGSGVLTEISNSPFATGPNPNGAVLDASGKFL